MSVSIPVPAPFVQRRPTGLFCEYNSYENLKLLPMLVQVAFDRRQFIRTRGAETSLLIDIDQLLFRIGEAEPSFIMEMHQHVGLVVTTHIDEAQGNRHQFGPSTVELRADKDAGLGGVSGGKLDDFDTSVEVEGDKVAWGGGRVAVSHHRVDLKRARPSIVEIIYQDVPPRDDEREQQQEREHGDHAQAEV